MVLGPQRSNIGTCERKCRAHRAFADRARQDVRVTHPTVETDPASVPARNEPAASIEQIVETTARISQSVESVIEGKAAVIRVSLTVMLAEGHLLLEDVPGVGKTTLAKTLARTIDCSVRRIQFTPDLRPGDVTGVSIFNRDTHDFEFRPGAVFSNIVVGDEINRASPKTQAALLECMEERQVTVDGTTYELAAPFMVIATQNPIEMEGTYPLPEAQRDRFMARVSMGYPANASELAMLESHASSTSAASPLDHVQPVADAETIRSLVAGVRQVFASAALKQYVVDLVTATRSSDELRLGASPRSSLHLLRAGKAAAAMSGRDHVLPDDIQAIAAPVLAHRLLLTAEAQVSNRTGERIAADIVARVPVPTKSRS